MPTKEDDNKINAFGLVNESHKKAYFKTFDSRRWGYLGFATNIFERALERQVQPVMEALKEGVSEAKGQLQAISEEPISRAFQTVYGKVGGGFGASVFRGFKSSGVNMQTKDETEDAFVRFMQEWVRVNGIVRIRGITENTRRHLRQALDRGLEEGMGIEEIVRMISGSRRIMGRGRARVIARTEIISASNRGSLEGAKRTNLNLDKVWLSTRDDRTRTIADNDRWEHLSADGQAVGVDESFTIQGQRGPEQLRFPGDPQGSPGNVIMCRCTLFYRRK